MGFSLFLLIGLDPPSIVEGMEMAILDKDNIPPLIIAALLGTSTGGGVSTYLGGDYDALIVKMDEKHAELLTEIRRGEYDGEIYKLNVTIAAMEDAGDKESAKYTVAVSMLTKFTEMKLELNK
jgi:hypothetical protein